MKPTDICVSSCDLAPAFVIQADPRAGAASCRAGRLGDKRYDEQVRTIHGERLRILAPLVGRAEGLG